MRVKKMDRVQAPLPGGGEMRNGAADRGDAEGRKGF